MARVSEDYRQEAARCLEMAEASRVGHTKAEWLSLALEWLALRSHQVSAESGSGDAAAVKGG
jgi:hypothetical protein